jgi:hypothetical protein
MGRLTGFFLALSSSETRFSRRGFHAGDTATRDWLEEIRRSFIHGYNCALETCDAQTLDTRSSATQPEPRGFAVEGAAMAHGVTPPMSLGRAEV